MQMKLLHVLNLEDDLPEHFGDQLNLMKILLLMTQESKSVYSNSTCRDMVPKLAIGLLNCFPQSLSCLPCKKIS